jgi:G3E family GTPase
MKTTVVCGLLGSGKTTFIRNRLQNSTEKTVVLVNDFGKAGIDGEIFSASGIESVELPSGCVCCTLKFDLITTITKIVREFSPEHLMIEPSGIASPVGVLEALESAGIGSYSVVGIVDVTEFTELHQSGVYGRFFIDQIESSDVILVNKTDIAEEEKISETLRLIESINPRAVLFRTVLAALSRSATPSLFRSGGYARMSHRSGCRDESRAGMDQNKEVLFRSPEHFHFETLSFTLNGDTRLTLFSAFFDDLARGRFGRVARAKALVQLDGGPYRFDAVFGKVNRVPFEKEIADGRLVIIGEELDKGGIQEALGRENFGV